MNMGLCMGALSFMNKYSFPSKYLTLLAISSVEDVNVLGGVNVALNSSQSSNTITTNTSPVHQTYLPFRARTNKGVVLFSSYRQM